MSPLSPDPASHTCPDCRHRCTRFTNHILTRLARLWYLPSTVLMMTSRQGLTLVHFVFFVSAFCSIGGAIGGCLGSVWGVCRGCLGVIGGD